MTAREIKNLKDISPDQMVRVIVELSADSIAETATKSNRKVKELGTGRIAELEASIKAGQKNIKAKLNGKVKMSDSVSGKKAAGKSLRTAINGFSTYMRLGDIETARSTEGVARVIIANEYERPEMDTSVKQIDAPKAWATYGMQGEGSVIAVIDSGIDPTHKDLVLDEATKPDLTESEVKDLKLPGKYFTEKVPYGYNYYDLNQGILDRSSDGHHGMHVAGTAAANGEIKGVAPEAQLLAMKVFSEDVLYATTFSDIYLEAIDDAVKLGADAINMSLGSPAGFYVMESMEDIAINNARANGVTVTISAGNERNTMDGSAKFKDFLAVADTNQAKNPDNGVVGSPSVNTGSLSVASFENTHLKANKIGYVIDGTEKVAMMLPAVGSPAPWDVFESPVEAVYVGLGKPEDYNGKDLKGKAALIERGELDFTVKLSNAVTAGAAGVVVFNHQAGGEEMISMAGGEGAAVPYVFIGHSAGKAMADAYLAAKPVTVSFTEGAASFTNSKGGLLSDFSSWGSTPDLKLKPEISAPGGMIYSTQNGDSYGTMSGTSMAAPHVAGGAALMAQRLREDKLFSGITSLQAKSDLTKALLMNTALPQKDKNGLYYDTRQQGAGMMNLANALETSVTVLSSVSGEPKIELKDFSNSNFKVELTLRNYSGTPKVFKPQTILLTDDYLSDGKGHYVAAERTQSVRHSTSAPSRVVVPANGTATVKFTVNFSGGIGSNPASSLTKNQYLGGFIRLLSQDQANPDLTVPVLGFYGDWDAPDVIDEWWWNLEDEDPKNDPEFAVTSPVNLTAAGGLNFLDGRRGIWLNPDSKSPYKSYYGTSTLGLLATMLRNAEEMTFRVTDAKGSTLRTIGESLFTRKIFRMSDGAAPYRFFSQGLWDGTVAGRTFKEGETVYYQIEAKRTLDSKADVYRFPVRFDNLSPVISYAFYDAKARTLELEISDAGSGVGGVTVYTRDLQKSVDAPYKGSPHMVIDLSKLDPQNLSEIIIEPYDNILNQTFLLAQINKAGETPQETPEEPSGESEEVPAEEPQAEVREDDAYGKPQIALFTPDLLLTYQGQVPFQGYVYGWDNIARATVTLDGEEKDLELTRREKFSAKDASGAELFFGTVWTFDQTLELTDNYYEMPITLYNEEGESFSIVRRFWVDTTAPVIETSFEVQSANKAEITLKASDNLYYLELYLADSLISTTTLEDKGLDQKNISVTETIPVKLEKGDNVFTFYAVDSAGNKTMQVLTIPGKKK